MKPSQEILDEISKFHLLKHPYYQAWTDGSLCLDNLRQYARQYFHHVRAFPRYLSAIHSQCEDIKFRQILLENLVEEERGGENHPELWLRFAEALGENRDDVEYETLLPETRDLISCFFQKSRSSFESGIGALFAYESQIPAIADFKINALKKHYGISSSSGLGFFEVHKTADILHSEAVAGIIDQLETTKVKTIRISALEAAQALWKFLDGVQPKNN